MHGLPDPDITSQEVPVESLAGTAKTIGVAALKAGYTVRATRAIGPRTPRQLQQEIVRASSVAVVGVMGGFAFQAIKPEHDAWEVVVWRGGWPPEVANTAVLLRTLKAQTPLPLGRRR